MLKLLVGRDYPGILIAETQKTKSSLKILMYDWRWYSHQPGARIQLFNQEILRAKKRKVEVKAVLNYGSIIPLLKSYGIDAQIKNASKTMHIKVVIFDEKLVLIGSHNLTINGFELNHEMSILTDDKEVVKKCNTYFNNLCHL